MSQKELAAAVGVSEQFLSALLKGKRRPNVRRLSAMALVLQTSVDFLALLSDDPTPPTAAPEPAPVYFSEEADAAAQLIDAMTPARRAEALALLRTMASFADVVEDVRTGAGAEIAPVHGTAGGRLILGALAQKRADAQGA